MKKWMIYLLLLVLMAFCTAAAAEELPIILMQGGSFTLVRDAQGQVWGWGDNRSGQLGFDKLKLIDRPTIAATGLDGAQIVDIQSGNENTLFLMADGSVYAAGANSKGQGGQGTNKGCQRVPTLIQGLPEAQAIACGFGHCAALTRDGHVWAWGRNDKGQVGNGSCKAQLVPAQVEGLENIVQISLGGTYSMALAADGTLYGWGESDYGQLRVINKKLKTRPEVIPVDAHIKQLSCGGDSCYVLDDDGNVWCWGRNDFHQLGHEKLPKMTAEIVRVELPEGVRVDSIIAYNSHTAAITEDGNLWIWGNTGAGQHGTGIHKTSMMPVCTHADGQVVLAAVGSQISGYVAKDGTVCITGYNKYEQLGLPERHKNTSRAWVTNGLNALTGVLSEP